MGKCAVLRISAVLWALGSVGWGAEPIQVVVDGRPLATVVIPADSARQITPAAELLVKYVQQSSGARLPIVREPAPPAAGQAVRIHLGPCAYVKGLGLEIDKLDDDGFVIRPVDARHIVIAGPTPSGTEFGVCEFLERYVGVRWLMPGADGDDVPTSKTIAVAFEEVRQEPAFFSRLFSGLAGSAQTTWARRNRMHGRVSFHHNLHCLFPPETYTKTHPQFFPLRNGKRYFPPTNNTHGWQPCFSAEGIVDEAIKNICRYFDQHPGATSYSLGVNDSGGHCECAQCQAMDSGQKNFIGLRDVSDRYYGWCNRVVEGVLKKHPDKFFGCLAYSGVAQPPSRVKVHERIVPYMTYDRMKWIDPEIRADGHRVTEWWEKMSPVVGWYDYIYGTPYCLPRVWFHQMADYYRYGHAHGVRALYAEAYPNWGEGPKLYVSLKLQWNPYLDVDQLLRDWYVRAVGKEAADDLAAYYAHWEDFWTRRILQSEWFTKGGQYLAFSNPAYLADVTEADISKSRALLEGVVQKAATARQKARAGLLLRAFEYYEASAVAYAGKRRVEELVVRTQADAISVLDSAEQCLRMVKKRQKLVLEEFPNHPVLVHPIDLNRGVALRGDGWAAGMFWLAFDWASKSDAVRDRLRELAGSASEAVSLQAKTMLLVIDGTSKPLSKNPSFEDPQGRWPAAWDSWVKWGVGTQTASPKAAHTGKLGVLCRGMKRGGPNQTVQVAPGRYAAVAMLRVPQPPKGNATVSLQMTPRNQRGENLPGHATTIRAKACGWTRIAVAGEIPARIKNDPVKSVMLIIVVDGFEPDEEVHIDDVAMFKIE